MGANLLDRDPYSATEGRVVRMNTDGEHAWCCEQVIIRRGRERRSRGPGRRQWQGRAFPQPPAADTATGESSGGKGEHVGIGVHANHRGASARDVCTKASAATSDVESPGSGERACGASHGVGLDGDREPGSFGTSRAWSRARNRPDHGWTHALSTFGVRTHPCIERERQCP